MRQELDLWKWRCDYLDKGKSLNKIYELDKRRKSSIALEARRRSSTSLGSPRFDLNESPLPQSHSANFGNLYAALPSARRDSRRPSIMGSNSSGSLTNGGPLSARLTPLSNSSTSDVSTVAEPEDVKASPKRRASKVAKKKSISEESAYSFAYNPKAGRRRSYRDFPCLDDRM